MRRAVVLLVGLAGACAPAEEPAAEAPATTPAATPDIGSGQASMAGGIQVQFVNAQGANVGTAQLGEESGGGVRIAVQLTGLTPGEHGFHIHETGRCDPPGFESAGGHYSPEGKQHGLQNPQGPHAGDLPNLRARADGTADTTFVVTTVGLHTGPANLMGGRALVVHTQPDDYRTDPSGNSGARVACGVIRM